MSGAAEKQHKKKIHWPCLALAVARWLTSFYPIAQSLINAESWLSTNMVLDTENTLFRSSTFFQTTLHFWLKSQSVINVHWHAWILNNNVIYFTWDRNRKQLCVFHTSHFTVSLWCCPRHQHQHQYISISTTSWYIAMVLVIAPSFVGFVNAVLHALQPCNSTT